MKRLAQPHSTTPRIPCGSVQNGVRLRAGELLHVKSGTYPAMFRNTEYDRSPGGDDPRHVFSTILANLRIMSTPAGRMHYVPQYLHFLLTTCRNDGRVGVAHLQKTRADLGENATSDGL
jgi:hypothetical protein